MRELVKIIFINSADYDYFELKVDGDVAVYGINDGGKTTCARAVMYGEHGSIGALNFSQGESMDYYFHKGPNDGLMIYNYKDTRRDGISVPYCLVLSSQYIYFVPAAYRKEWFITSDGKLTTDWSKIRTNIEALEGDVKTYQVSSKRNLELILQGAYFERNEDMRSMSRMFNIFEGKDGRSSATARIIESLWKNGAMQQQDMKRIIIDRSEADKRERLDREPNFEISSARSLSNGFDDGWKDFSKYLSGELPELMNQISTSYKEYVRVSSEIKAYPAVIKSIRKHKRDLLEKTTKEEVSVSEDYGKCENERLELERVTETAGKERSRVIGEKEGYIKSIKQGYNRYFETDWVKNDKDISDWDNIASLNAEITALENTIRAIEDSDEAYTKTLLQEKEDRQKAYEALERTVSKQRIALKDEQMNDAILAGLIEKKAGVKDEAMRSFFDRKASLKTEADEVSEEEKAIRRAEDCLQKINDGSVLSDKFESSEDLSFLGGMGRNIIRKFFRMVYAFICKELFGLESLSKDSIDKKKAVLQLKKDKYNEAVTEYTKDLQNEIKRLSTEYEKKISDINTAYAAKDADLVKQIVDSKVELETFLSEKDREIESVRRDKGIDVEDLKRKKVELEKKNERYDWLFCHKDVLSELKSIRRQFQELGLVQNELDALVKEDREKSIQEKESKSRKKHQCDELKDKRDELRSGIKKLNSDLNALEGKLEEIARVFSCELDTLKDMIEKAPETVVSEEDDKALSTYVDDWKSVFDSRNKLIMTMRTQCQALQGMLSDKDFFNFSIKPEDSLTSDSDILRVAETVTRRNDVTSDESIIPFLNNWRGTWNQYLRFIYQIAGRATELSNITRTTRDLQAFINRHNEAHSISEIRFEIEPGSDNQLVAAALALKECIDNNGVDVYTVEVTDGIDTNLFKLETISGDLRRRLIGYMSNFTKALSEYKLQYIPPEDFFTLYTCIKEENKPMLRLLNVHTVGSTGTGLTAKAILTIGFVGEALRSEGAAGKERNAIHVFVDEFGRIDPWNKEAIKKMCKTFNVRLFSAEPYASTEKGDVKYGYSLHYDKRTHHRGGMLIKERRLEPVIKDTSQKSETINDQGNG